MITQHEASVLAHASGTGRYVTGEMAVSMMAERGLLRDHGAQALAAGDNYYTMTAKGRDALKEWREAQPKPKKRRASAAFESWERYQDACGRIPFSQFWRNIWPLRR